MNYRKLFIVEPGRRFELSGIDPGFKDSSIGKSGAAEVTQGDDETLRALQYLLYAQNKRSVLIVLQGLDAAGKDGTIAHVFGALNPQGARVHAFKQPSAEEAAHDFLWRAHAQAPRRGEIVIFNRSHYEDVLVVRVHGLVPKSVWTERYDLINAFERTLAENGTLILKFFLHMSPEEQLKRFKARLDDPNRQWKISEDDYTERAYFAQYLEAYQDALERTSTEYAPWYVIPSDHKWFRNLAVSKIVAESMQKLHMHVPQTTVDLDEIRRKYHEASAHG
jgi:PPK2 family polyphosphate:nucleotide phosphotransferase